MLRNKLSSASKTITSHCFPGIKSNLSKPKGPNLNIKHSKGRKWQWEMSVCWGEVEGKNQVYTQGRRRELRQYRSKGRARPVKGRGMQGIEKNLNEK